MAQNSLISNFAWKFAERISVQLISTVVSIVLARIIAPQYYGAIAMVMVFVALANTFVQDGFGSALVQKKNTSALDFFSVLYFNIAFSIILYVVLFFCAPYLILFYGEGYEILKPVIRVLGVIVVLNAVRTVLEAYVSKKMIFRKFFISTLSGTIISAILGIVMAYTGYGIWALVGQSLTHSFVTTLTLCLILHKRPQLIFSYQSLKNLFPFGAKILGTGLFITAFRELRALIIGKIYSPADLAFFDKGRQFPALITTNIVASLTAVLFPKMATEQDNKDKVKETMRRSIRLGSYVLSPLLLGFAAVSESFIKLLLGEAWLPCVPMLQLFCVIELFYPIHSINMQSIKALGRGNTYLGVEMLKKVIELITLVLVMRISVMAIVLQILVCNIAFTFVNAYPNKKHLNYGGKEQLVDLLPNVFRAILMYGVVSLIGMVEINNVLLLMLQIIVGVITYILLSVVTPNKEFNYVKNIVLRNKYEKNNVSLRYSSRGHKDVSISEGV